MRPLHKILILFLLAGVIAFSLSRRDADASTPDTPEPPPVVVSIEPAITAEFAPLHWAPGSVISRRDARVAGEQAGRVSRIVDVGQRVAQGDPVATLDDTTLRLREREIEADAARIRAQLDMARLQEDRYARLAEQQSIARAQYDQIRADHDMLAQEHARVLAQLSQLKHQRGQMVVRAPFAGIVAERHAQMGEYLAPGTTVIRLVDVDAREIRVRAPIDLAPRLRQGTPVKIRSGDDAGVLHVSAVVPVGDETSRQLELRIESGDRPWPVGTALDVGLPRAPTRAVVAVPRDAIVLRREGDFVLRIDHDGKAERLPVKPGEEIDGMVEVEGAVRPGDRLVVRGGERLAPGQQVSIEPMAAPVAMR